jgi:glycosyltransferase domain-containing protein
MGISGNGLLTVILPLRDRSPYTEFFLRHSIFPEYHYLLLDGSTSDANEDLVGPRNLPNVEYVRYPPDLKFTDYLSKVGDGLGRTNTPYLVMIDNDDLLLPKGTDMALSALRDDSGASLAGGDLIGFCHPGPSSRRSSWPMQLTSTEDLAVHYGIEAIRRNRTSYRPIWNLVSKTEDFRNSWTIACESSIVEPHLIEFLIGDLMLAAGSFRWQRIPHYLRLENQPERAIHKLKKSEDMTIGSDSWWVQANELEKIVAGKLGVDSESLPNLQSRWRLLEEGPSISGPSGRPMLRARSMTGRATVLPLAASTWLATRGIILPLPLLT